MKNINRNYLLLIGIILIAGIVWNQQRGTNIKTNNQNIFASSENPMTEFQKQIVTKFREGNVSGLSEYFGEEVSITVLNESDFYTKDKAGNILLQFCQSHKPKKFFVKHHGANANKDNYYLIGNLITTTDEKFRVYISNDKNTIETIEITTPRNL